MIPLGALGVTSEVRRANCSAVDVLPPIDTLILPEDGTGTIQDLETYNWTTTNVISSRRIRTAELRCNLR
jgi:hypothetical protein